MMAPALNINEFKRNYWESLDKLYWGIFLLVFVIELVVLIYLQSLPVREMTEAETLAFQRRVFNVLAPPDVAPVAPVMVGEDSGEGAASEEEGEEIAEEAPAEPIERQQETVVDRATRRAGQEQARTQRQAAAQQAAAQTGLFAAVGGDYGTSDGSGASGLVDTDVRSSGAVNVDQVGTIHTGGQGEAIREIRGGLQAGEGEGSGLDIDFSSMSASELRQLASVGGVTFGDVFGDGSGGGGSGSERNSESLMARVMELKKGLQTCYERNKRRKQDFAGSIKLFWTLLANGQCERVSIDGTWNDDALGSRVEKCIKQKVEAWNFEAVDPSAGDQPLEVRFTFQ
ncbi:MAG: AgmX/PglI C-terminal domain-containing protein [Candidatus Delongbacteria bacterium]|nr:AgmX/PglI C-terminal domain-containing protein [Candidatus Delongbacteria bacterium]